MSVKYTGTFLAVPWDLFFMMVHPDRINV